MMKKLVTVLACVASFAACADEDTIWDNRPANNNWENSWYPLGNGRLGCMVDGGVRDLRLQFNVDSLWTGDKNLTADVHDNRADQNYATMGAYQNFGELVLKFTLPEGNFTDYKRELDLEDATYEDEFEIGAFEMERIIFASAPADAIFIRVKASQAYGLSLALRGAHNEGEKTDDKMVTFSGELPNGLKYVARADVIQGDANKNETIVVLQAVTGKSTLAAPKFKSIGAVYKAHKKDYQSYYKRFKLDLGEGDDDIPTRERLARVKKGGRDIPLIALQFNFGRYLLISCSRPGTLPANLQGIWNNSNNPPWHADYHTNINIQENYWGADAANLSECFTPLSDWMMMSMPTAIEGTRAAFPNSKGYAYRTSANAFGGGGWRWNFAGAPWMAAQCYDHYLFTRDKKYLRETCWPLMKGAAEFMLSGHLKERPDGTIVVKDGWSPEHGPREDGVTHDQQIVRELFRNILDAAKVLNINDDFVKEVARVEPKLLKDKIGKWGQLQEWETDRDVKGDQHRHTSHLFAVYPGSTISRDKTPELAKAAKIALDGRAVTGDSRRSWTWPWRAAIYARLGEGNKAGEMLENLLRYNTLDNMFATHPPFQIDGNLAMIAAVCEILTERAIPDSWARGSVKGLKTRAGKTIQFKWNHRLDIDDGEDIDD